MTEPGPVDFANLAAQWASVTITALGLGGLIAQAESIRNQLDIFHKARGERYLGEWVEFQSPHRWYQLVKPPPKGPIIKGNFWGVCGVSQLHVSRQPHPRPGKAVGKASWTAILAILHPYTLLPGGGEPTDLLPWQKRLDHHTYKHDLVMYRGDKICTKITRIALIVCLVVCNANQSFKYSGDSGLRVSYGGYTGSWQIQWPIGGHAEVEFFGLDSHDANTETHPLTFARSVDKCVLMLVGVIHHSTLGKLGFAEPKDQGYSLLKFERQGFSSNGKTTHLYNMMRCGNYYEVDYLVRYELQEPYPDKNVVVLTLPSPEVDLNRIPLKDPKHTHSTVFVPPYEQEKLATALDCLPWSQLAWSMHRGMQCLLVAYAKPIMDLHREALASNLKTAVSIKHNRLTLISWGWESSFIKNYMGSNAANSVKKSGGESGDNVRIVTDIAKLLAVGHSVDLEKTHFWREQIQNRKRDPPTLDVNPSLTPDTIIALTKLFVLEWSQELDYKLYEDLPLELLVG
ncbi:hypothetical protein MMC31_002232 [Peltigera leucophlebia]|nr:hypothetical protein [Peltigera leucophlebia]